MQNVLRLYVIDTKSYISFAALVKILISTNMYLLSYSFEPNRKQKFHLKIYLINSFFKSNHC